jgi:hypothetical protein
MVPKSYLLNRMGETAELLRFGHYERMQLVSGFCSAESE